MNRAVNVTRPGHGPETFAPALPDGRLHRPARPLLQELYHLYTAERQLASDLRGLFDLATAIHVRLALSDQRRVTTRQILRLERAIQMTTGAAASQVAASLTTLQPPGGTPDDVGRLHDPSGSIVAFPLRAAQAAIAEYGAALSVARLVGQVPIADLLGESLQEKRDTIVALSGLPDEIE